MKIRTGFVSNSSSASFVLRKHGLSKLQKGIVKNYNKILKALLGNEYYDEHDDWHCDEEANAYYFHTIMDNIDLKEKLVKLGIPETNIDNYYRNG